MNKRWKYFSEDELRCQGTGEIHMDEKIHGETYRAKRKTKSTYDY